jgi:hypothetical protein
MPSALLLIPVFEMLGLLGFIQLAQMSNSQVLRYLPLVLAAILVVWIAIRQGKTLTLKEVAIASFLIALVFVACFQFIGLVFTGLAKDVDVFSVENFIRLSLIAIGVFVGHAGLLAAARWLPHMQHTER